VIDVSWHYDNSPNNRDNPDPNAEVNYGPQTWDEMLNGFLNVIVEPGTGNQPALGPVQAAATTAASGAGAAR